MQKANAKCQICGKGYHRCGSCKDIQHYKNVVDTPECFGIYCILHEYREGVINISETAERLKRLNIRGENLLPAISENINAICTEVSRKSANKKVNIKKEKE